MLTSLSNAEIVHVPGERLYESEIYAKDLTTLQAKTLQRLSVTADIRGIIKLLGENINIDINQMYFDDFKYLIHWYRLKSFADFPHQVGFTCYNCNQHNEQPVLSKNLMIEDVPSELTEDGGILLPFDNYPKGLYIRAPKIGDEFITEAMLKKHNVPTDDIDTRSILLDLNLFRNKVNGIEIEELFKAYKEGKFTPSDLMIISAFRKEFTWGVKDTYEFVCTHCKEEVIVEEPLDITSFFQPSESKRFIRDRILPVVPSEATTV